MPRVVGIGINVMDIYRPLGKMFPGGNEFNICYHVKKMGGEAGFMGVFADDAAGELLRGLLKNEGVDVSHSHREKGSSGYAIVDLVNGDRVFVDYNRRGVTDLHPFVFTADDLEYIRTFDLQCISYASRLTFDEVRKLADTKVPISYDFSDSFTTQKIEQYCPLLDFAFFSCSHTNDKGKIAELLKKAWDLGPKIVVSTLGAHGALAYDGYRLFEQMAVNIPPVDTMGAGDAFIAAFIMSYLQYQKEIVRTNRQDMLESCLVKATNFAAKIITEYGSLGFGYPIDINELGMVINI